jgi:glycosyltransferase involved in cell wall biosynthesis
VADGKRYDACWMGRYNPMKGCDDLLSIWELVCKERTEAKLAIMGSASKQMEPLIKERHLGKNIDVLGFVTDEVKFRTLKESKVFPFPSYYESWGMVASEALACGLPVVAYDLPVYRTIYTQGVIKVPIGDQQNFACQLIEILKDENLRKQLAQEAVDLASHWKWDKVYEDFLGGINHTNRLLGRSRV